MLLLSTQLWHVPIMSLQIGEEIAYSTVPIIDPRDLMIVALYVDGPTVEHVPSILHISDIREVSDLGFIVDDSSKLMATDGLVRLQTILDMGFEIIGCQVFNQSGRKLGKVSDFSFAAEDFSIQQIHVAPSWLRSFSSTSNIINRTQIISVAKNKIVVDAADLRSPIHSGAATVINPFRSLPRPDHEHSQTD